jgi:hypothetical protein
VLTSVTDLRAQLGRKWPGTGNSRTEPRRHSAGLDLIARMLVKGAAGTICVNHRLEGKAPKRFRDLEGPAEFIV